MVQGNLNYFFNALSISPVSFAVNYDFSSPSSSGNIIPSVVSGNPMYSGIISNTTNYYGTSGSGNFISGNNIQIQHASGLSSSYCTLLFVYERQITGDAILFSSLMSGNGNVSGFNIGVNTANRMYFETFDNTGPVIYTSSNIYGSKNAIAVVKSNNVLNFHYYNFNEQIVESESFNISQTALYNSNQVYLAATGSRTPSYITQNPFSGYLSQFCYFNLALTQNTVQKLFSGIYCTRNPSTTGVISFASGEIFTGFNIAYTGIGTGITGQQIFLAGTFVDSCGSPHNIFSYNNLTGIISGYQFFPLTGAIIFNSTGIIDQGYTINTGFAASFGMDGVVYDRYVSSGDFSELYTYPNILETGLNNIATYSLDGTFKLNSISTNGQFNLFVNGVANYPSGIGSTGTVYVQTLILSGDYYTSGQSIISTGLYLSTDTVIYDYLGGVNEFFNYTGGTQSFPSNFINDRVMYWNGQKIPTGLHYSFAGTTLTISGLAGSGLIFNSHFQKGWNYFSGNLNHLFESKFGRGASQLWLNGIREELDNDYFEISKVDLLNGSGLFQIFPNTLYNNQTNFFQPF